MPKIDLTGQRFGSLVVLCEATRRSKSREARWKCRCDCGAEKDIRSTHLRSGAVVSCGCYHKRLLSDTRSLDLTGKRFGALLVLEKEGTNPVGWKCRCDCGNIVFYRTNHIISRGGAKCPQCRSHPRSQNNALREAYVSSHGKVPDGYTVTALDGDIFNTNPDNLIAVSYKERCRLYRDGVPAMGFPEIKRVAVGVYRLERAILEAEKR